MQETTKRVINFSKTRKRVLLYLVSLLGLAWGVYALTLHYSIPELEKARARLKEQKSEIKTLGARLESVGTRLTVAEQEAAVMRRANQLLREGESERQAEVNRLQSEVDFYQRLAGTSGSQSGLAVYHMEISPTGSGQVFRFVLTLTQNLRRSAITTGKVHIELQGTLEDRPLTLPWAKITDGSEPEPDFRFKYFQQLDGYLVLPENFDADQLVVTLKAKGQSKPVSRSFDWASLLAGAPPPGPDLPENEESTLEHELGADSAE